MHGVQTQQNQSIETSISTAVDPAKTAEAISIVGETDR
jgi:hypothetical protein